MKTDNEIIEKILQQFSKLSPAAIVLFGSCSTEYFNEKSDIDLAVLMKHRIKSEEKSDLSGTLSILLQREIDLIDLNSADTVFQFQILKTGKLILLSDKKYFDLFKMRVFGCYQKLNEEREGIIRRIYGYV